MATLAQALEIRRVQPCATIIDRLDVVYLIGGHFAHGAKRIARQFESPQFLPSPIIATL